MTHSSRHTHEIRAGSRSDSPGERSVTATHALIIYRQLMTESVDVAFSDDENNYQTLDDQQTTLLHSRVSSRLTS